MTLRVQCHVYSSFHIVHSPTSMESIPFLVAAGRKVDISEGRIPSGPS